MKVYVLSDLHLEFEPFEPVPAGADAVVLAGDIHVGEQGLDWALDRFPDTPVIYVTGNHEYYGDTFPELHQRLKRRARGTQVHVLENDAVTLGGVRFLGCTLWTDFRLYGDSAAAGREAHQSLADYHSICLGPGRLPLQPADTIVAHEHSKAWLTEQLSQSAAEPAVVVTHHAPSARSIAPRYRDDPLNPAFVSDLDLMVENSGARLWVHGHTHTGFDYRLGQTRVVCNPRGYPGEHVPGFDPGLTVEI